MVVRSLGCCANDREQIGRRHNATESPPPQGRRVISHCKMPPTQRLNLHFFSTNIVKINTKLTEFPFSFSFRHGDAADDNQIKLKNG